MQFDIKCYIYWFLEESRPPWSFPNSQTNFLGLCNNLIITIVTTWPRKYIFQIQTVTKIRLNSPLFISLAFGEIDKNLNYIWPNLEKNNSKRDAVKYPTFSLSIWLNISIFPSSHNNEISHQNIEKHGENLRKGVVEWN